MCLRAGLLSFLVIFLSNWTLNAQNEYPDIEKDNKGQIQYVKDESGNSIPDFSFAGFKRSVVAIPNIPAKIKLAPLDGNDTERIQQAIDYVATLPKNENGFRGAVVLERGQFEITGTLYIKKSGIVLRGSGNTQEGTILVGNGVSREAMIRILGKKDFKILDSLEITESYVPLGSQSITIKQSELKSGDQVFIKRKLDQDFLDTLQMNDFGAETGWIGWKKEDWDLSWDREVMASKSGKIDFDAPLTMALNPADQKIEVLKYSWPGRLENTGIENLIIESEFNPENPKDEQHRWLGISIENAMNVWVRRVNFKNMAGGAVHILKTSSQVTVEDCISEHPVSEIAAFRRHTFYTEGQLTLFQRCFSEYGYHDFAVGGYGTTGPNVFLQCEAFMPFSFSGTIGSWATGVLFDVVNIDGDALSFANQGQLARGSGWTAANSVIWESSASKMEVPSPPIAQNWAFGTWGQYAGNGHWKEVNSHISPRSLFYAQLEKRTEDSKINPDILKIGTEPSSSPTIEAAEELTNEAENELTTLKEWIENVDKRRPIQFDNDAAVSFDKLQRKLPMKDEPVKSASNIQLKNGALLNNGKLLTGKNMSVMWWRGSLRDEDVQKATPHVTRFAPGRRGRGLTDNLGETVSWLKDHNVVSLDHNYGLWYDRRMDDHQRVRRYDADTWPPFYEQPFDRSGEGTAWDHLSKYDLTKYNTWYWWRLQKFAELAEKEGELLFHQQYFQHNIIEAGAHWASSPWRSANNINETGFPEPPPYAGDKRIFMARQFYDVTNEKRRNLHKAYIEKSLSNFVDQSNVIQFTSAEFTGPLHFMQFWIDVVKNWETKNGDDALIGLSATKDVQDAILNDDERVGTIDVIDIKYWYYRENGETYEPLGGKNLAPRQHARKMETGKESTRSVYRAVREYRENYPEKAVLYNTNGAPRFGWAVLMAKGSLPNIPHVALEDFYQELPQMKFANSEDYKSDIWSLQNTGKSYLFYLNKAEDLSVDLSKEKGRFEVFVIEPETGEVKKKGVLRAGSRARIQPSENEKILFIKKV